MTEDEDPVFKHPEAYGIENPEAPGEPNREAMPESTPVPGTGRTAREEHMRRHDQDDARAPDPEFRDRIDREEREDMRRELEEES